MYETDAFFEKDLKIIKDYYMPKEENNKSVASLIYEFFHFYVYEYDSSNMVINIKETGSDALKLKSK
jgi:DNA polymerase sigma